MARARKQIRGDELVAKVFRATLAEVGRVGVEHLSIEEVAERADVNKTTIYRRWPTPEGLARAALACAAESNTSPPDTGSLRGDLRAFTREFRRIAALPDMKTVMRLRWSGTAKGPLARLTRGIQEKNMPSGSRCWSAPCRAASCPGARTLTSSTTSFWGR
jgi:AcrR family transcriptional regulator